MKTPDDFARWQKEYDGIRSFFGTYYSVEKPARTRRQIALDSCRAIVRGFFVRHKTATR